MLPHKVPIRYSSLCAISLLVGVWIGCAVSDVLAQVDYEDITVSPELHPSGNTLHGYAEYRIVVSNRSPDKTHQVTLILPETSYGVYEKRIREMTRSVVVGPSATVHVSLLQPPVQMHGRGLGVAIDGKMQEEDVPLGVSQHGRNVFLSRVTTGGSTAIRVSSSSNLTLQILVSRDVDTTELHTYADSLFDTSFSSSPLPSTGSFPPPSGRRAPYEIVNLGFPVSS